ncbi:MAG: FG-GAP repeat protein, partial [Gammaproteobacteria bacterium]
MHSAAKSSQHTTVLPVALRPALYQALAKDAGPVYQVNKSGCATLPKQALKACFDSRGAYFKGPGASRLALHLVAFGRGVIGLKPLTPTQPEIIANRVSYAHGNLSEWWRVLPVGFEQGFTVAKRPAGHGELTLALTANGKAAQEKGALGWGKLRYGELVVIDAKGKVIPSTLKNRGDRILIAMNDTHAVYPLTVDPLVWLEQKVTASNGEAVNAFGNAVAVEGETALIGAPDVNDYSEGAVYAFHEAGGVWTQTQEFFASDGSPGDGANFGATIAIDGTTALIGAVGATVNGNSAQGAAYIFTESNGTWSQAAKLTASDGTANNYFGQGVAIEGTTVLVGAYGAENLQGEVYEFTESAGTWTQTQILTAGDAEAGDFFGQSVALSGTTALIGAYAETINGNAAQGAAYVFTYSGGSWSQVQKLVASDGTFGADFGYSVALSGSTALIGAGGATVNNNFGQGAVYVFGESGSSWSQTQELTASDGAAGDDFGYAVALSGTTALIGADRHTVRGNANQGAAYEFAESAGTWTQTGEFVASDGAAGDFFGSAVATDGTISLVGAPIASVNGNVVQGAAYFYGESNLGLAVSAPQTVGQGQQYVSQTIATNNATAASPAVSATITVPAAASFISASATQGSCSEASGVVTC